jgi:tetratricopeptide (TPR) repeat protein
VKRSLPIGLLSTLIALQLTACSAMSRLTEQPEATLADLPPAELPLEREALPRISLQQLADVYRDVLQVTEDPDTRLQVQHRLADIEMLDSETRLTAPGSDSDNQSETFAAAISAYETLLGENPDNPRNDQLLYQLSKAYEFSGDNASSLAVLERLSAGYPDSPYYLEAEFRRAESYFASADYAAAELAYTHVVSKGRETTYYVNALYMQGWSRFKQGHYNSSVTAFTGTLDSLVPADNNVGALARGQAELVQDCLRVLAVVFSNLDGANSISSAYDQLGVRPYQHLLYQALGDLYLAQERYRDSAETYKAYTLEFPGSKVAHQMQLRVIDSYEAGGFPQQIVEAKRHYVELFTVNGSYWQQSSSDVRDAMRPELKLFIGELANYYHALAQEARALDLQAESAVQHYRQAGEYYQLYINSFPLDPDVPEMGFLLAESLFDAGDYAAAIGIYEWVAYGFVDYERCADAAYAAVLAYDQLERVALTRELATVRDTRIDSELRFAAGFSGDSRAPAVLNRAAAALVERADYQAAIIAAATLVNWQPSPGEEIIMAAQLVMGHSHFELQQYAGAEQAYQAALAMMPSADTRYPGVVDALAASIYRQGEEAVAADGYLQAAQQFARVTAVAPESAISVNAQYDAAINFMLAGELIQANRRLIEFRRHYPDHELSAGVAASLVENYEQLQQWDAAAVELDTVYAARTDSEGQRQALYLAAQYYDRAGDRARAIERYRSYAHGWAEPLDIRMEAMNRLAQLYQADAEDVKRHFWLQEIVAAHDAAAGDQSERSRYLAAYSSSELADARYQAYSAITLRYPLQQSLQQKKTVMQRTLAAYSKTGEYAVQQFSTLASYRMAQVYRQLGTDLMASERPGDIDALALEQYELMLEEQAWPFEEKAIAIHESNARRSWNGIYDEWVRESFVALAELLPARYAKLESSQGDSSTMDGEPEMARRWFEQRVANDPANPAAYNRYGIFLREQGRFAEAEQVYLDALAVDDSCADTHRNIGILYDLYRGEREQALQHYYSYQQLTGEDDRTVSGWIADLERQATMLVRGD